MINSAIEQGKEQEKYEVAKKLVLAGVAIDIIVATTGLDKEKIEKLK